MSGDIMLFDYWRSSASYRLRIALESLGLSYAREAVDLLAGEQRASEHRARNPQGLVGQMKIPQISGPKAEICFDTRFTPTLRLHDVFGHATECGGVDHQQNLLGGRVVLLETH